MAWPTGQGATLADYWPQEWVCILIDPDGHPLPLLDLSDPRSRRSTVVRDARQ